MDEFLQETIEKFPTCRIFSVRHTREVVVNHGHGHYVLRRDALDNYYWKTDWNAFTTF